MIKLLESPASMASGNPTIFLSSDPNELCATKKILLKEKQSGEIYNIIDEEIVALADKLSENKRIFTKQHKFLLLKCLN